MKKLYLTTIFILLFPLKSQSQPVIPNFQQGILNQHTEVKSVIQETIKSYDMRTGYQFTVGGENVKADSTNIAPSAFSTQTGSVQGTSTTYALPDLDDKPAYSIVNEGQPFSYYESLEVPGVQNYTEIIRETTIESISDSTSTFQ